jgi:hypothetical protein
MVTHRQLLLLDGPKVRADHGPERQLRREPAQERGLSAPSFHDDERHRRHD